MPSATERIARLRKHAIDHGFYASGEANLYWGRSWNETAGERWHIVRRARATASALQRLTPVIDADELIVGKFAKWEPDADQRAELEAWARTEAALPPVAGQRSHQTVDIERLLTLGVDGVCDLIKGYRKELDVTRADDLERDAFYRACLIALDGFVEFSERYAEHAEELAAGVQDEGRSAELLEIAQVCRHVPRRPARTFWEALQAAHILTFALCASQRMLLFQLGRPDRYLLPYYRRDLAAGRITPERAQELIDCACLMLCEYTPRGLAVGFAIGGRDASGMDICNELTEMFLESVDHVRLSYPGVALCWTDETPSHLMVRAAELLADGCTHPALFADDTIAAGLRAAGVAPAESVLWIHSTCVEITPIGSSNVYVASPYLNMVQLLHDAIGVAPVGAQAPAPQPQPIASYEELLARFRANLFVAVRQAVIEINTDQMTRRYHGGAPFQSCFVMDCLSRGRDIDHGGARHNWIEPVFVGTANLVDALAAIRALVFEQGRIELSELVDAMRNDYIGREDLRQMILNEAPKYGNDDDSVDELAAQVTSWYVEECRRYQSFLGGTYQPGMFCWIQHGMLGAQTAASADGRHAGIALADGAGAAQGRDRTGPTTAVLSATKWDHRPMIGGIAVNLRFSPTGPRDQLVEQIRQVCETFLKRGGAEIQVNVVDTATLLDARKNPEAHQDLIVRIAGYSDFFVSLPDLLQEEVMARSVHGM